MPVRRTRGTEWPGKGRLSLGTTFPVCVRSESGPGRRAFGLPCYDNDTIKAQ